jgi:predicted GNAT family acetyltransferase
MPSDKEHREDLLDETIEESFPASDAPANTVETGTRVGDGSAAAVPIEENSSLSRFEFTLDGQTGVLDYERLPGVLKLMHTEVPVPLRHHGLGGQLVEAAILAGRADGLRIIAVCGFARAYMRRRPRG